MQMNASKDFKSAVHFLQRISMKRKSWVKKILFTGFILLLTGAGVL